ncbi:MAG: hypothetical protein K5686_04290 [Lachnospiraceae bacterium]|nr:hypothetical protein [Lachnospiraceae bacterium]
MKRVNKKTLKDLTVLMPACFASTLLFFVLMNMSDLFTKDPAIRSLLCVIVFSADMLFLVLFMSCIYGIRSLHEDFSTVWLLLFFRILLIFAALLLSELGYLSEFYEKRDTMVSAAYLAENASLMCFVFAYKIMTTAFARLLEKSGVEKQALKYRKGAILYLSIGVAAVLFSAAALFVPGEGRTAIMAGVFKTAGTVTKLAVILLQIPIYLAIRDAIGTVWRTRLEREQEGRRIR